MSDLRICLLPNGARAIVSGTDLLGYIDPGPRVLVADEGTVWIESCKPAEIRREEVPWTPSSNPSVFACQLAAYLGDMSLLNVSPAEAVSLLGAHGARFVYTAPTRPVPSPDDLVTHFNFIEVRTTGGELLARRPVDTFMLRDFRAAMRGSRGSETWRLLDADARPVGAAFHLSAQAAWRAARSVLALADAPVLLSDVPTAALESSNV